MGQESLWPILKPTLYSWKCQMKKSILPLLLFIFIGLVSPVTQANSLSSSFIQLAQNDQSLNNAVQSVKQKTGGRILSTKTVSKNGQRIHKIKVLLPSGKVRVFSVTAQ